MLAGLARDGGLYVPETWPRSRARRSPALPAGPFHEVAVEVIAPFIGGDDRRRRPAGAWRARPTRTFGHAAVTPLVQIAPDTWVLELFHGPTLAFKDVAMQLLARLLDHVLAKRGERATIVGATSGDTGGAAIEAFARLEARRHRHAVPARPRVGRAAPQMTTATEANVHKIAIEGTFDDCQALVKGDVQPPCLPRRR